MNVSETAYPQLRYPVIVTVGLCLAYLVVFVVGIAGNSCVVMVVCRSPKMRSSTNLFIANLACADLLVTVVCLPFTLVSNIMSAWTMGWLVCKTVPYLQGVSVNASINTLVAISAERCCAICFPMRWHISKRACRMVILAIWLLSASITVPWALFFKLQPLYDGSDVQSKLSEVSVEYQGTESYQTSPWSWTSTFVQSRNLAGPLQCICVDENWTHSGTGCSTPTMTRSQEQLMCLEVWPTKYSSNVYFIVAHLIMCYLLPLFVISVCYLLIGRRVFFRKPPGITQENTDKMVHKSKVKVVKMLMTVIVLFALSWLPLYAIFARIKLGGPIDSETEESVIYVSLPFAQWLGASNSCINPVLYAYFNRKFRTGFKAVVLSRSCCSPLYYAPSASDLRTASSKQSLFLVTNLRDISLRTFHTRKAKSCAVLFEDTIQHSRSNVNIVKPFSYPSLRISVRSVSVDNIYNSTSGKKCTDTFL